MLEAPEPPVPALELSGLTRRFGADPKAGIAEIDLRIEQGEFVAIVGPSGAGKSTLLNILGLLDSPTGGSYKIFGRETSSLRETERDRLRASTFGFVFQQSFVLGDASSLRNAALGLRIQNVPVTARGKLAFAALERLGISHRAETTGRVLSGGEQQRLAIARAVATRPQIVLADEPTGNLDSQNGAIVLGHLRELHGAGSTVILITHDESIAASADRLIRIADGSIVHDDGHTSDVPHPAASQKRVSTRKPTVREWCRKTVDDMAEALGVITSRVGRTLFLMLAFALGVGGLVASLGVSESASAQVSQRLTAAALDEVRVTLPGGFSLLEAEDERLNTWMADAAGLEHVVGAGVSIQTPASSAGVRRLSPAEPASNANLAVMSASSSYLDLAGATTSTPDALAILDNPLVSNIAFVGEGAAAELRVSSPGPGSSIWVNGRQVNVVGIIEAGARQPELSRAVVVSKDVIRASATISTTLLLRTEVGFPAAVAEAVPFALDPANTGQFTVETVADLRNLRFGVASDLGQLVGIVALILLGLATISAATTMYISVQSRAHEIALRRAVGASRGAVARLFVAEGLIIGLIGGAVGAAVGTALALAIVWQQAWEPILAPWLAPFGVVLGVTTGLVSSVIPAWAASRQDPALALRAR